MATADPNQSFQIQQGIDGNYTCTWKPALLGIKFALPLIWIVGVLSVIVTLATSGNNASAVTSFVPRLIGWFLFFYIGVLVVVNVLVRRKGSFNFNKEGFSMSDSHYANKDIVGVYVRSPKGEKVETLTYTTYHGFGVAGAVSNVASGINAANAQVRMALMRAVREKSYSVCIQYGEREIRLAKHLTLLTAKSMLHKIDELV